MEYITYPMACLANNRLTSGYDDCKTPNMEDSVLEKWYNCAFVRLVIIIKGVKLMVLMLEDIVSATFKQHNR